MENSGNNIIEEKNTNLIILLRLFSSINKFRIFKKSTEIKKLTNINFYKKALKRNINNNISKSNKQKNILENDTNYNSVSSHKKNKQDKNNAF